MSGTRKNCQKQNDKIEDKEIGSGRERERRKINISKEEYIKKYISI